MRLKDIPVRLVGPGTQPLSSGDGGLSYIDMPGEMDRFVMPRVPEPDKVEHLQGARDAMGWLQQALAGYRPGSPPLLADLGRLDEASRELVNQILGEGEVSARLDADIAARTQESVLAGVWRTVWLDRDGSPVADILEVGDVPSVMRFAGEAVRPVDTSSPADAAPVVNAMALLVELQARCERYAGDGTPHSMNLSLLPLSDAELAFLDERLGRGPVDVLSRSYGKCEVISTLTPDVWWVRYYNAMGVLILNSLEVVGVPDVVRAAPEDLRDSASRLDDILEPYWPDR